MLLPSEVASRSSETLQESCRVAAAALGCQGSRGLMIVVDETVWAPMYEVMVGLRSGPEESLAYVGGYFDAEEDNSYIPRGASELPLSKLSKMSVHYAMTRVDINSHCYIVDMIPRPPGRVSHTASQGRRYYKLKDFSVMSCCMNCMMHGLHGGEYPE